VLFHEFGAPSKPIIMLFPGTMCHWKANFEKVIPRLLSDFFVLVVSYTGFDGEDREDFQSILAEVQKIKEKLSRKNFCILWLITWWNACRTACGTKESDNVKSNHW